MVVSAHSPGTVSTVTVPILVTRELHVTIVSFLISDYAFTSDCVSSPQNKNKTKEQARPNQKTFELIIHKIFSVIKILVIWFEERPWELKIYNQKLIESLSVFHLFCIL